MRILHVHSFLHPHRRGGDEVYILELSKHLMELGHDVHVITSRLKGMASSEVVEGVPVERIRGIHFPDVPYFLFSATLLVRLCQLANEYDIVHAHGRFFHSTNLASVARNLRGHSRLVVTLLCTQPNMCYRWLRWVKPLYERTVTRFVVGSADAVIAQDESPRKVMEGYGIATRHFHRIPNGVDTDRFYFAPRPVADPVVVGYAGRLVPSKAVDTLLRAFARLRQPALLRIVGVGPERAPLECLARELDVADRVNFVGAVDRHLMPAVLQGIDILVLPSLAAAMPTALLEAMSMGKAVVATRVDAIPDVIHSDQIGALVPPGDVEAMAGALERFVSSDEHRLATGARARQHVATHYSWPQVASQVESLYASLLT